MGFEPMDGGTTIHCLNRLATLATLCYVIIVRLMLKFQANPMTTHFISAEVPLTETPQELVKAVEQTIAKEGKPLRWAIAKVDQVKQTAQVEAVVTR
jgi:hypothetical protein